MKSVELTKSRNTDYDGTQEFQGRRFMDKQHEKRFFKMMDPFTDEPTRPVPGASGGHAGANRFLNNDSISREEIPVGVQHGTIHKIEGMDGSENTLLLPDTMSAICGMHTGIEGMGYYADSPQKGRNVHNCLAVTGSGVPIGLADHSAATRTGKPTKITISKNCSRLRKRRVFGELKPFGRSMHAISRRM